MLAKTDIPSAALVRKLLRYDPETGDLYWLPRDSTVPKFRQWNGRFAGRIAFTSVKRGYLAGTINGCQLLAHRVAWALYYGEWPAEDIDHIDGVRTNNRISNLRAVARGENNRNRGRSRRNTSGATGVTHADGKWRARIKARGQDVSLGCFSDFGSAAAARKAAERNLGFHENHGKIRAK